MTKGNIIHDNQAKNSATVSYQVNGKNGAIGVFLDQHEAREFALSSKSTDKAVKLYEVRKL